MSKTLPKAKLEEVIALTEDIHELVLHTNVDDIIKRRTAVAQSISNSYPLFYWSLIDLVECVRAFSRPSNDLLLELVCKVLEVLGWQVVEDEQAEC